MKAQGLPLNILVIGAMALIVLVLIGFAFQTQFSGALNKMFGFTRTATPDDLNLHISTCRQECDRMPPFITKDEFVTSTYCKKTFDTSNVFLDTNGDPIGLERDNCWDNHEAIGISDELFVPCEVGSFSAEDCDTNAS